MHIRTSSTVLQSVSVGEFICQEGYPSEDYGVCVCVCVCVCVLCVCVCVCVCVCCVLCVCSM